MKFLKYILLITLVLTSCKTKKNMIDANAIAKEISAKKVAKKHIAANFDKKTLDAKLKVNFNNGKIDQSFSVNLMIEKDKVIWLKGTKFITVFKAKITPTTVSYYSPFAKNYFEGDFSMIKQLLGVEINFEQLQNLFLGQSLLNVKEQDQELQIVNNRYILSPEKQAELFHIFFTINPSHFKLDEQTIVNVDKDLRLDVKYPSYNLIENVIFPSEVNIKAKTVDSFTEIDIIYKSVEFNTNLKMSYDIPNNYKRLEF
ncbi:DUF4292 domain-containing protein [Polaribacter glomeratus]|uniref:Deoxyuridine 5'-triphosphate nucleotidohydrolase n=1 Tax=Polaribacter glomeratus TaxID=102 RepID=A0A2S7WIQ9_9FLAO|nr:DUF4292 domain-containing protein [Polaribacter glomeratus]PQJ77201.1 hypothetical protein BTO16_15290 [Polaribacter glomeratus]TXD65148.1 DUF4292 domain-containing protein [Polaribacter glomeratus]